MRTMQIAALLSTDVGLLNHCRRVAALAHLIAHHLFLPTEEKDLLHAACLLHHHDTGAFSPAALDRLLKDVLRSRHPAPAFSDPLPLTVRRVHKAAGVPGSGALLDRKLGEILRLCDALDQELELQPLEGRDALEILAHMEDGAQAGLWSQELMEALRTCLTPLPLVEPEKWPVPPFPQAAVHILKLLEDPSANIRHVAQAASLDPAAAGTVMQLANSALFGMRIPAATLAAAIARLGFVTAHRVLMAVALRPVLRLPRLEQLWPHSLEVADLSEQLALRSKQADPGEAYLAGLLHDIGRIALLAVPLYDFARLQGLQASACPAVYAENLLLRTDHATLGGRIARMWRLPEETVAAIQYHHVPDETGNRLAHILYLAEYLSDSAEDLPSQVRMNAALRSLGMTLDAVNDCTVSGVGSWLAAA